jgi:hypothetical protein
MIPLMLALLASTMLMAGCGGDTEPQRAARRSTGTEAALVEVEPQLIALAGDLDTPDAEVSGMVWYGDQLVIVPQHPERLSGGDRLYFYKISRAEILARLDSAQTAPIVPERLEVAARGLPHLLAGFDGLEAVAVRGDRVYVTVEAAEDSGSVGYLVAGAIAGDLASLRLDLSRLVRIPGPRHLPNMSCESLVVAGDRLLAVHEANGVRVNPDPRACVFDLDLNFLVAVAMPSVEYRVTDATEVDADGRFWVINYFYPPEKPLLDPASDPELSRYGQGQTHGDCQAVERLLEFRYDGQQVTRTETPPLLLRLRADRVCRNWEALVRLDERGFLLMTDRYPRTLLAFVPLPD